MISDNIKDEFVLLFLPKTGDDFWNTKYLLENADIQYKVEGKFVNEDPYSESGIVFKSEIHVRNKDLGEAKKVCEKYIQNSTFEKPTGKKISYFKKVIKTLKNQ